MSPARVNASRSAVSAAAAAIAGLFGAAVFPRATWPLIDGDVWWHIRAGQNVLRTGSVPRFDTWSLVAAGRPWTSQDWLANVILAAGNSFGPWGRTLLSLLFGLLVVTAFWLLWRAIQIRLPSVGWANRVVWLAIGLTIAGPVLGVRVQVIDLLLACAVLWTCWQYVAQPKLLWLICLPLLAVAWANLHAGWVLLFLIVGATLVGEVIDWMLHRRLDAGPPLEPRQLLALLLALIAAAGALALNPNGIALYAYPLETLQITTLNRYVMEWFPATPDSIFGQMLIAFSVLALLPTLIFGRRRLRTSDALLMIGLTLMAFQAIRFLMIAGPIDGAIAAAVLGPVLSTTPIGRRISPTLGRLARPRHGRLGVVNAALVGLLLVLGAGVALGRSVPAAQERSLAESLPVAAVDWMTREGVGERAFNLYEWGGYLGQHRPDRPIFIDGRADVYGDALLRMYVAVIGLDGDPQQTFDRYRIDAILFPSETPLAGWLDRSPAWHVAYADDVASVWVRAQRS